MVSVPRASRGSWPEPPIVGRDREITALKDSLDRAIQANGSLVLVSGEAGIGKTSLVQALMIEACERNALVLSGGAYDLSATPPYGPWLDLTDRYPAESDLPALPDVLRRGTGVGDLQSQLELFAFVRDFFVQVSEGRPLLLVLEDLHWSDQASLDLLRYLSRQIADQRILIIATYRDDEITRKHPLFQLLPALVRESQAERIELGGLASEAVQTLVRERWSLAPDDEVRLLNHLTSLAEGHPLFTVEVLRTIDQRGFLRASDAGLTLTDLSTSPVPVLVQQVIEGRLARLDDESRHLLEVAAVIGHEVSLDVWRQITGMSETELLPVVEKAINLHLLEASSAEYNVRFIHALTREVLYESSLPLRRRIWHRLIGEALAGTTQPVPDAIAYHFKQAGDSRAAEWLIRAGEQAQRSFAWLSAVECFLTVSRFLEGDEERTRERGWLRYRAARLRLYMDPAEGVEDLDEAMRIAALTGDSVLHAASLVRRGHLRCFTDDVQRGIDEMYAGVEAWDALSDEEKRSCEYWDVVGADLELNIFRGTLLLWLALVGRYREILDQSVSFLREIEPARERLIRERLIYWIDGYAGISHAYAAMGHLDESRRLNRIAWDAYSKIHIPLMVSNMSNDMLRFLLLPYYTDQLSARAQIANEAVAAWRQGESALRSRVPTDLQLLPLLLAEGRWDEIMSLMNPAPEWYPNAMRRLELYSAVASVARNRGAPELAWEQISRALSDGADTDPGGHYFGNSAELIQLAVQLSLDNWDLGNARSWLESHDRWLAWNGTVRGQAEGLLLWGKLSLAENDVEAAKGYAQRALEQASEPRQPMALIAIHRFLGELYIRTRDLDSAVAHLGKSRELIEVCALPFERALTLLAQAELEIALSNPADARALLNEVRRVCTELEARPTLDRVDELLSRIRARGTESQFGLSPREVEVLQLVVQGMHDKDIADKLYISPRTVMQHVSSILRKLDVDSRTAAATRAVREGFK